MGTKTLSIKDEAYDRLKALKGKDQSFSDVILELTDRLPNDFSDIIGLDIELDWDELREERKARKGEVLREKVLSRH